jgi:hypothetical protein
MNAEQKRLKAINKGDTSWRKWGTYLSERAWGTVREDYSPGGTAWDYFPHDHARSRAYRWNEDGLLGFCDEEGFLCFGLALWNGEDAILKERAFGLGNAEGNHGEDVKEYFYYLDNLPTHSYCRALYKYPQSAFPYSDLVNENKSRGPNAPEYELIDTGVFDENRYFDVLVEYAKNTPNDILIQISVTNRGSEAARLELLPTFTFRNIWDWKVTAARPQMKALNDEMVQMKHHILGNYALYCQGSAELLFTENQTNDQRLYNSPNKSPYVKDAFHQYLIHDNKDAINPERCGTKMAARYTLQIQASETQKVLLRLTDQKKSSSKSTFDAVSKDFDSILQKRRAESDEFYNAIAGCEKTDAQAVQRQALAGLLWCKQFYHYDVERWLKGDPTEPLPPEQRLHGRNSDWIHLNNHDVISMPDSWEYPWYASWDLAFHCVTMAMIDADFAKNQLILLLREWYQHPNGQIPAYEWAFSDVNPPVHAWAALRVFRMEKKRHGAGDYDFLERVFQKLLLNFTWWVNRKDVDDRNLFQGGFLGLDNIGPFDRNEKLPDGARLDQADGTAWMAMFCLDMLSIALELAQKYTVYEDVATKFLEHFFYIAHAMNDHDGLRENSAGDLWDNQDQFYYDLLEVPGRAPQYVRVRSLVGLIPLLAVTTINKSILEKLPGFAERLDWFLKHRPHFTKNAASVEECGAEERRLFAVVNQERLRHILQRMLDENEFLSPHGIRSVSRFHQDNPFRMQMDGETHELNYEPAESQSGLFGGNSNWRGPVWIPINYLVIEALQKFDYYYGASFTVECPAGSGQQLTLWQVASELSRRLYGIFLPDQKGNRPVYGEVEKFQKDPHWKDLLLFHEYFHGDSGQGLGASHQTGWTALVAKLIQQSETRSSTEEIKLD